MSRLVALHVSTEYNLDSRVTMMGGLSTKRKHLVPGLCEQLRVIVLDCLKSLETNFLRKNHELIDADWLPIDRALRYPLSIEDDKILLPQRTHAT